MKKILFLMAAALVLFFTLTAESCNQPSDARASDSDKQAAIAAHAITATPIPDVSYFPERRTISKWAEAWDKPDIPTYVYLISFGKVIGYYVCNGKPASSQS